LYFRLKELWKSFVIDLKYVIITEIKGKIMIKFLTGMSGMVALITLLFQLALMGLVIYLGFYVYTNGLEQLYHAIMQGFNSVGGE